MEAVNRQSGVHSLINRDHYYAPTIKVPERDPPPGPLSTPGAVISPSTMYPSHPPPPYSHSSSAPPSAHPYSGMISPSQSHPDSRRASSDNKEQAQSHRQSLPSIQEALLAPAAFALPRNPVEPPPPSQYGSYAQYPPTPTSRANSMDTAAYQPQPSLTQPQRTSPSHTIHTSPYHRPEPAASAYEHPRHTTLPSIRTALPSQAGPHPGPAPEFPRHEADPRAPSTVSAGYSQQPSHGGPHSSHPAAAPPISAESAAYSPQSPYQPHRHYRPRFENGDEPSKLAENSVAPKVYGPVVKRHLDYWDIEIELSNIRNYSGELLRISQTLLQESQRNTSHGAMPERVPSHHDLDLMRVQHEKLSISMQRMSEKVAVQGQYSGDQHGPPPGGKAPDEYSQEDMSWDDGRGMSGYVGSDAKKRRGRAAPPGRCHSCNRAETPEWRRGPDGARTLCNACGLHYAKLTRKLGTKQAQNAGSSLRQTTMDAVSPRS